MLEEYQENQRRKVARARSIMDFVMGVVLFLVGVFFIIYRHFGIRLLDQDPSPIDYVIGIMFCLYGGWRIYRGYKKDYFG